MFHIEGLVALLKFDHIAADAHEVNFLSWLNGDKSTGPFILKIAKVISVHKNVLKLLCFQTIGHSLYYLTSIKSLKKIMYHRIYKFLDKNNLIYSLQFGFWQHYSTSYALVYMTEAIMKALDDVI